MVNIVAEFEGYWMEDQLEEESPLVVIRNRAINKNILVTLLNVTNDR